VVVGRFRGGTLYHADTRATQRHGSTAKRRIPVSWKFGRQVPACICDKEKGVVRVRVENSIAA
jgi:hypothetical protein